MTRLPEHDSIIPPLPSIFTLPLSNKQSRHVSSRLATELHVQILSDLDLISLLSLTCIDHYFQRLMTHCVNVLRDALLSYEPANPEQLREMWQRSCYGCLRMQSAEAFFTILGWEKHSHFGVSNDCIRRQERRCYECDEKAEKGFKRAVIIELVDVADETCRYDPGFAFSS
jgi:hypothetical protein